MAEHAVRNLPAWPVPISQLTTDQLADAITYLRAHASDDEVLIRAVQNELTFRQAGIRPEPECVG